MNPILYAIPIFMLTLLAEAWEARRRKLKVYDIADAITSLHLGILSQVSGAFSTVVALGAYAFAFEHWRLCELPANDVRVWIGALIAYDFCYYWLHRMSHELNILWAAHVVHHSSEYYNLSTALRQTSTGNLFGWLFYLPLALVGIPPTLFVAVALADLLYQYWVHTELVGQLGWFDRVFCSPSNHRVHHGQNDYCIDKNYGGILILWDRMFGTFEEERRGQGEEPICYGIRSPLGSFSPLWANLHHYARLWHLIKAAQGLAAKSAVLFDSPGGRGQALPHFEPAQFVRFHPATPLSLRVYVALHYVFTVALLIHFLAAFAHLNGLAASTYALAIFATCMSLGAVLEGGGTAIRLEQLRVTLAGLCFATLPDWFGFVAPTALRITLLLLALGSAGWLASALPGVCEIKHPATDEKWE